MSKFIFRIGETDDGAPVQMDLEILLATKIGVIANSGGGKSYALRVLVERTGEHVQWILLDPGGEFASLRKKFPNMLLVGAEGELPVDLRSAQMLARKIMETRVSTIVDLYGLRTIRAEWAADFLNTLINLPKTLRSPVIVAVDEAHLFAPETPTGSPKEKEHLAHSRTAVITLADSGRKDSRGAAILTQRVSKLAADARAELRNRLVGLSVQDLDRDRAADDLGMSKRDALVLRDLNAGEFFAFGPAFLNKGIFKMRIDRSETPHPSPGEYRLLKVPPAGDALKHIVEQLGDLPAQAEEEARTIAEFQTENARLKRELTLSEAKRPVQTQMAPPEIRYVEIEKPVLNGEVKEFTANANGLIETLAPLNNLPEMLAPLSNTLNQVLAKIEIVERAQKNPPVLLEMPAAHAVVPTQGLAPRISKPVSNEPVTEGVTPYMTDLLRTFARRHPFPLTKSQLATLARKGKKSSALDTSLAGLKRMQLVTDEAKMRLTEAGFAALGMDVPAPVSDKHSMRSMWRESLDAYERSIFDLLVGISPRALTKIQIAEHLGKGTKSSKLDTAIALLIDNEIVERFDGSFLRLSEMLR